MPFRATARIERVIKFRSMDDNAEKKKRRGLPWVLGLTVLALFVILILLQTSNLWKNLAVETASDTLLLYALSSFNFIALIVFGFILLRNIVKLIRERRALTLGSKIKTRLLLYFFLVSLLPIFAMGIFSFLFMNRALDRWFSDIPINVMRGARSIQTQSLVDRTAKLDESARMVASALEKRVVTRDDLVRIAEAGNLSFIEIVNGNGLTMASYEREVPSDQRGELADIIASIHSGALSESTYRDGRGFDVAMAEMTGGRTLVVVPNPFGEETVSTLVDNSLREFDDLKQKQVTVRQVGLLTLGVLTFLLIFASIWIAFYVARGLTVPIQALAGGAREIAGGNLGYKIDVLAEDELALLIAAFNEMSARLESNSAEISERRKYIETVLATLPTGVISFDSRNRVGTMNRAAANILRLEDGDFGGVELEKIVGGENRDVIEKLLNRARRVGRAREQTKLIDSSARGESTVALSATALPTDGGVVLVIEDLSELIQAQRASAWQEVARRMAHEIKNPLTPIQLSAERIAKRFERSGHEENGGGKRIDDKGPVGDVVLESTATIIREVSSLKSMVDEFSRFARLPTTERAPGDLNAVISQSLAAIEGRDNRLEIEQFLSKDVPELMIDAEQMGRVFSNLIENSVEAFGADQEKRTIAVRTRSDAARDIVVVEFTDNGKGIPQSDLPKLFQPYFSTKGRGTGLGLAIVNRIIAEHSGKIFAAANQSAGAKFIIELPVGT